MLQDVTIPPPDSVKIADEELSTLLGVVYTVL